MIYLLGTPALIHVIVTLRVCVLDRQSAVGLNSMFARVAGILAPLIRLLEVYHPAIPMSIYGVLPFAGGGLCFLLPETLNTELQDHTMDM